MEIINIKNVSVQPSLGPSVSMRIINNTTQEELKGTQAGDILNAKAISSLLGSVVGIQGPKGDKGDTGATGPKGDTGATGPMPTLINNLTSTSTTAALAAAQGKALNDLIIALTARVAALEAKP